MRRMKFSIAAAATFAIFGAASALAQNPLQCSNATLIGDYAFTLSGQILAPPPAAGIVTGVALTHFDGQTNAESQGSMTQVDHVIHNGVAPAEDWRPGSGPYQVNPDCTGWMTITPEPTNPADGGAEIKLYFVIGDNGNTIHTVVSGSPTVAAFAANITSTATRVLQFGRFFPEGFQTFVGR